MRDRMLATVVVVLALLAPRAFAADRQSLDITLVSQSWTIRTCDPYVTDTSVPTASIDWTTNCGSVTASGTSTVTAGENSLTWSDSGTYTGSGLVLLANGTHSIQLNVPDFNLPRTTLLFQIEHLGSSLPTGLGFYYYVELYGYSASATGDVFERGFYVQVVEDYDDDFGDLFKGSAFIDVVPGEVITVTLRSEAEWLAQAGGGSFNGSAKLTVYAVVPSGPIGAACSNGIDDDGDGFSDYGPDPGCLGPSDFAETETTLACDDGQDNDSDNLADYFRDPGCRSPESQIENPQCQDGDNNDGQVGIDFDGGASVNNGVPIDVADPQCTTAWKNREAAPKACGLGFELAAVLPAALWLHGQRASRTA